MRKYSILPNYAETLAFCYKCCVFGITRVTFPEEWKHEFGPVKLGSFISFCPLCNDNLSSIQIFLDRRTNA